MNVTAPVTPHSFSKLAVNVDTRSDVQLVGKFRVSVESLIVAAQVPDAVMTGPQVIDEPLEPVVYRVLVTVGRLDGLPLPIMLVIKADLSAANAA